MSLLISTDVRKGDRTLLSHQIPKYKPKHVIYKDIKVKLTYIIFTVVYIVTSKLKKNVLRSFKQTQR